MTVAAKIKYKYANTSFYFMKWMHRSFSVQLQVRRRNIPQFTRYLRALAMVSSYYITLQYMLFAYYVIYNKTHH